MDISDIPREEDEETPSAGDVNSAAAQTTTSGAGGRPRKEVPLNPQTQPDNVCFYRVRGSNMLSGKINPSKVGVAFATGVGLG